MKLIAAYENLGSRDLVWTVAKTAILAKKKAAKEATIHFGEKIALSYFKTRPATQEMIDACKKGETILVSPLKII